MIHSTFVRALALSFLGAATQLAFAAKNEHLDAAREFARKGDWELAMEKANLALGVDPKSDGALRIIARSEIFLGDTASAISHYKAALAINPKQPESVIELTTVFVARNQLADADTVVSNAEKKDSKGKFDEIKVARALILGKQGKIGEATPILASATAKHPDNALYPTMLARIYANANVTSLAADNYEKAWQLDEGNPDIAFEYGQILLQQKAYDAADRLFKIVQEKDPDNKQVDFLRGRLRYAAKRYAEAATEFQKSVEKNPDNFLSNYWLGKSYVDLSKAEKKNFYGSAIPALRKALELKPERQDVRYSLAEAEFFVGRSTFYLSLQDTIAAESIERVGANFEPQTITDPAHPVRVQLTRHAITQMENAAAQDDSLPKSVDVYANIARAFDKLGELDSSLVYTDKQLELTPASKSDMTRKVSLLQRKDDQAGLAAYLEVLGQDSAMFEQYGLIMVNAYIETKQYDQARATVNKVIARSPGNCDAHQLNAYIDLKRERYSSAINVLLDGVKSCPNNADLWGYLGDSYYFSNENDKPTLQKAKDAYCKACDLGGKSSCEKCEQIGEIIRQMRR